MIADQFDAFFVDLDGVIYLGHEPLPDAVESLARLREMGKEIRFLTNDPTRTRNDRRGLLDDIGVEADEDEIVTSSWAAAGYLRERGLQSAYTVGSAGLDAELKQAGVTVAERDVDAVVIGSDDYVTYADIKRATLLIRDGAEFVATNTDATYPRPEGRVPGTGAIVSAIRTATDTRPQVVGKPEPSMFRLAAESLETDGDIVMLGDTPSADILGAHRAGYSAVFVGDEPVTYPSANDFRTPDATVSTLAELFDPERAVTKWERPPFEWPETVRATVVAVVRDEVGAVFLVRESADGDWKLPLARIEPGETVADAATRAASAYGIDIDVNALAGVYSNPQSQSVTGPSGETTQLVTSCVQCSVVSGAGTTDGEGGAMDGATATFANPTGHALDPMHATWLTNALDDEVVLD